MSRANMWRSRRWILGIVVAISAASCGQGGDSPVQVQSRVTAAASEIFAALPKDRPGYGTTDYPGNLAGDVPKAYAMVLLAETDRLGKRWREGEANLARVAGEWLLANKDADNDGVIGWGLPVAWDAYDDRSTNPPNTEYTISTAIVIDALLTWSERDPQAPREQIRDAVAQAIEPYLQPAMTSPSGMAPYSLEDVDRRYDTFNPAAYLAGQIQRASLGVSDPVLRARYLDRADATMRVLLQQRRLAPGSGHWYWNYSIQQDLPNDLPHAGYMIDGIRNYIESGGRLADEFDWTAVLAHLRDFRGEGGKVRAFPTFFKQIELAARSYDLGFALHLACTESGTESLVPWLIDAIALYRTPQARYLKMPVDAPGAPALAVNEYETYLYRGLTSCALHAHHESGIAETHALRPDPPSTWLARDLASEPAVAGSAVPLLPAAAGVVSFDQTQRAALVLDGDISLAMPAPGVPVKVMRDGESVYVFLRHYPEDRLSLLLFRQGRLLCQVPVDHAADPTAVAALRAATLHAGRLHAVVYHNPSLANWYLSWALPSGGETCPTLTVHAARLPSLGNPAGSTYEMVPRLWFMASGPGAGPGSSGPGASRERLMLVGGNVEIDVDEQGLGSSRRVAGCQQILESAPTPQGPAHLCIPITPQGVLQARVPVVVAPGGVAPPQVVHSRGIPWRLRWSLDALHIDHARTPRQLRHLLRHDITRSSPGGWLEFGINNEEGRVPWSQIYYLEGWLDILDLAGRDPALLELFGPLLPEVRRRLDMEISWLDAHVGAGRYRTRAFTVDRSQALFGVQTGRLLLTLHRYHVRVPKAQPVPSLSPLRSAVQRLDGHIEVLATSGEDARWIRPGLHHLRWPKGCKFPFDGVAVPFNHQNEWAHSVLGTSDAATPADVTRAATDVIQHFIDRIAPQAILPESGSWDYWWGRAYDGWTEADQVSVNKPRYVGDHIKAWISFRTIDAMALVVGTRHMGPDLAKNSRMSTSRLVRQGLLYPFANHVLVDDMREIHLARAVAIEYGRASAPWEISNAPWSAAALVLGRREATPSQ